MNKSPQLTRATIVVSILCFIIFAAIISKITFFEAPAPFACVDDLESITIVETSTSRIVEDPKSSVSIVKDELIVVLEDNVPINRVHEIATAIGGCVIGGTPELRRYQIRLHVTNLEELSERLARAKNMQGVKFVNHHSFHNLN